MTCERCHGRGTIPYREIGTHDQLMVICPLCRGVRPLPDPAIDLPDCSVDAVTLTPEERARIDGPQDGTIDPVILDCPEKERWL